MINSLDAMFSGLGLAPPDGARSADEYYRFFEPGDRRRWRRRARLAAVIVCVGAVIALTYGA